MATQRRASKSNDVEVIPIDTIHARPKNQDGQALLPADVSGESLGPPNLKHGMPQFTGFDDQVQAGSGNITLGDRFKLKRRSWFQYVKTRDFWLVLVLGCV